MVRMVAAAGCFDYGCGDCGGDGDHDVQRWEDSRPWWISWRHCECDDATGLLVVVR